MNKNKTKRTGQQLLIATLKEYAKNPPTKYKRQEQIDQLNASFKLAIDRIEQATNSMKW